MARAAEGYLRDGKFIRYLDYLQYWKEPQYTKYTPLTCPEPILALELGIVIRHVRCGGMAASRHLPSPAWLT